MSKKASAEATVPNIRRKTRKKYSAEEKLRIAINSLKNAPIQFYKIDSFALETHLARIDLGDDFRLLGMIGIVNDQGAIAAK